MPNITEGLPIERHRFGTADVGSSVFQEGIPAGTKEVLPPLVAMATVTAMVTATVTALATTLAEEPKVEVARGGFLCLSARMGCTSPSPHRRSSPYYRRRRYHRRRWIH
jgi:hypothetical protein